MKPLIVAIFLSLFLAAPTNPNPLKLSHFEKVKLSLVKIEFGVDDDFHVCTGFVTDAAKGEVLTAAHCVPPTGDFAVEGTPSHILKRNDSFALVEGPKMTKPPLSIRESGVEIGEVVTTFGYGWNKLLMLTRSVAAFIDGDVALDGPLAPGMSGGPVVDLRGEVVGVNQASNAIVGVACGSGEIRAFLAQDH